MPKLESLTPIASVRGILPDQFVTVVNTQWSRTEALEVTPTALKTDQHGADIAT